MDLPELNFRPGKVVEAEIRRRFSSPVSFDPNLSSREFFLVLSFGRCKFRLSEQLASHVLQSVMLLLFVSFSWPIAFSVFPFIRLMWDFISINFDPMNVWNSKFSFISGTMVDPIID